MACGACGSSSYRPQLWAVTRPDGVERRFLTRAEAVGYAVRVGGQARPVAGDEE